MAGKKDNPSSSPRDAIVDKIEASRSEAPVVEESVPQKETPQREAPEEEQAPPEEGKEPETEEGKSQEQVQEPQKKLYAGKFEKAEDLEKAYQDSLKGMNESQQKAATYEKQFQGLRNYIDWNRLQGDMRGEKPQPQQPQAVPKEQLFQDFAEKGVEGLYPHLNPYVRQAATEVVQSIMPNLVNTVGFKLKLDSAYETFNEQYADLKPFEEDVGRMMLQDLSQNPRKNLAKVMHDASKKMREIVDGYVEKGKQDAQTEFKDKQKDNLPPTGGPSKDKVSTIKKTEPKTGPPDTLEEYIRERRSTQERFQRGRR